MVVVADTSQQVRKNPIGLSIAFFVVVGTIFAIGAGLPLAATHDLKLDGFSPRDIIFLWFADMTATIAVIGLLVWLFSRIIRSTLPLSTSEGRRIVAGNEAPRIQLPATPDSLVSVTENTTRTLDATRHQTPRSL